MRPACIGAILLALVTGILIVPRRVLLPHDQTLTFVVWGMPFEDALFRDAYARGFEAEHPGWRVEYQRYADVRDKYNAWNVLGRGADVMRLPVTDYHDMIRKGAIEPLDRFINDPALGLSAAEQSDFLPAIWSQLDVNGSRFALPSDNAQYGLLYNIALFDAHNAAHPDAPIPYPDEHWTWDDLRRAAQSLTKTDAAGNTAQYGIAFDLWAWPFMAFLAQAGGELWDSDQSQTLINSDAGVEALTFLADLVPSDLRMSAGQPTEAGLKAETLFKAGRLAMMLDGSWRVPNVELDAPDLDFAVAPLPHFRRQAIVSGSVLWAVSSHSRHKQMAWEMVRYLTSREQSLKYWDALRVAPPARMSAINSDFFTRTAGITLKDGTVKAPAMPPQRFAARAAWLRYALAPDPATGLPRGFVPVAPRQRDLEDRIMQAMIRTVRGEMTARAALDDAANHVNARQAGYPPDR